MTMLILTTVLCEWENKEIETMLNRIDYINFMARHIVGNGIESDINDMTRADSEEWSKKFFSAL